MTLRILTGPFAACLLGVAAVLCVAPASVAGDRSHSAFTDLLQTYVAADGRVDYSAWKRSDTDIQKLAGYLGNLSRVNANALPQPAAIAHYLNLYNASMIKLALEHYPVSSVKKIGGFGGPWKMKYIQTAKGLISLDEIEHGILRKRFKEPRIHFALVCASVSCPPLRVEGYEGDRLDTQLADQERRFFTDTTKNRWRIETAGILSKSDRLALELSSILKWFEADFGGEKGVVNRLRPYLSPAAAALIDQSRYEADYLDYDWSLNGK
jgi:hypothetical protein